MAWGLGSWKRPADSFRLTLGYGYADEKSYLSALSSSDPTSECKFKIELDWSAADEEEQVALKLQSQLMVTLPPPQDQVQVEMSEDNENLKVALKVVKKREALRVASLSKTLGSGQQSDGVGVIIRMLRSAASMAEELLGYTNHWKTITLLNLSACALTVLPVELIRLPYLERLHLDNNKLSLLPPELGELKCLKVLRVDHNMLVSVPVELRQCVGLIELSLEHNKLVRPLLDFRAMSELRVLRLFGNPLEFLPEILPLSNLRHLSLANVRIEGNQNLSAVHVDIETENSSYFVASRHKLSAFFSLVFRFSSCQHPLLASALAKITEDNNNRNAIGRDENAVRQLISMLNSDNRHVVEQACSALSSLASDTSLAVLLMKADIMQPIESVLKSVVLEELISVLHVVVNMAFASDVVASKMLTKDLLKSLKLLCAHESIEVQRLALLAVGNLAFCWENRRTLIASESLRELLLRLTAGPASCVSKAAARALAILGENEHLRRAIRGRPVGKQGLRVLSMDGGGMRGLATVQMLRRIEQGTGKRIHEIFDLICGTSTGGMLAIALGIKGLSLDQCEEIYKNLGKLVFAEPITKDNEAATWREKLDQLYKSSSQNFRVVVHGSKHNADQFERLLKEMCADEDGDLLIDSAVRNIPKVFVVSTLVSVIPAQPFVFRNYQYPPGTPETTSWTTEGPTASVSGTPATATPLATQIGQRRSAFIGSCKHHVWEAIRASSAAPYYLDDFAEGATVFLKSIDASGKTKNAEYLCGIMDEVIKDVGEENVVQIVTDNAANYVAAGKLLMERHPHLFWTPCAAHCIDLMLEDLGKLPWIKTVIERGRSVCKFIYNHTWVLNLMRKHNGQRELSRPGVTRFAINFLTLKSLLDSKGGLRRMFVSEEWLASSYATTTAGIAAADHIFDEPSFWTPIADIVTFVKPLIVLLRIADGEKPSMGYIYEGMDRVKEAIRTFFAGNQDRYGPIWDVIDRRWHNLLHRPIHAAAYFLNPAYQFSPHFKADDEVWSGLYDVVERMSSNSAVSTNIVREIELFKKAQGDLFARELCKKNRTALMPDVNRWQDGAIVANNPTLIAIREAQLLWPDTRIGCLISLGCGNLPTKPRGKGGWRYLDTGQVLIESACSVERVEETLDTLLPMLPDIQYFRFNPVDERCGMELDETDPAVWVKLEAATQEYVEANNIAFQAACERLLPPHHDKEAWSDITKPYNFLSKTKTLGAVHDDIGPCLGWRRRILLAESSQSLDLPSSINHVHSLQTYCSQHGIKLELLNRLSGTSRSAAPASTPYTSPMFTGSFPTSPLLYSPEVGLQQLSHLDLVPPLSLDGGQNQVLSGKVSFSPPRSPPLGPRQLSGPVRALQEKLQSSPQVGIVHFALQCNSLGLILSWRNDVFVVAEPGGLADTFLQGVRASLFHGFGQKFKKCSTMPKISTISGLVARYPRFQLGGVLHRFMGRQTQVMADDQEIAAYMFQRMLPAIHLTSEDVRWMGGVWRERIIICTGKYGPSAALLKAFLDSGAKAIIAPSLEPPELQQNISLDSLAGSRDGSKPESGRFVIGEDDEDEGEPSGPSSDWEDSDFEECEDKMEKQHEEKDLCSFVCTLYDNLFREGVRADIALQNALDVHPKQHYRCHLPKI